MEAIKHWWYIMKLKCKSCGNIWNYKGAKLWATCTNCYNKVKVVKNAKKG